MTFKVFVESIISAASTFIIPLLVGIAFVSVVWGIVRYFFIHGASEDGREHGKQFALWGILGLVLIFSVWGIVHILLDTLGFAS